MKTTNSNYGVTVIPTVVDMDNNIIREYEPQHNLISDWGLNSLSNTPACNCITGISVGTGTEPTHRNSGDNNITVSQVGNVVTASGDFFHPDDGTFNRLIQFSNNTTKRIVNHISETEITVSDEVEFTDETTIIWVTERSQLDNFYKWSNALNQSDSNNHGTEMGEIVDDSGVTCYNVDIWRTIEIDFDTEDVIITEAGWNSTSSSPLFGRIVFDTSIPVSIGTRLLIKVKMARRFYDFNWELDPIHGAGPAQLGLISSLKKFENMNFNTGLLSYIHSDGGDTHTNNSKYYYNPLTEPSALGLRLHFKQTDDTYSSVLTNKSYTQNSLTRMYSFSNSTWDLPNVNIIKFYGYNESSNNYVDLTLDTSFDLNINRKIDMAVEISWDRQLPKFPV